VDDATGLPPIWKELEDVRIQFFVLSSPPSPLSRANHLHGGGCEM